MAKKPEIKKPTETLPQEVKYDRRKADQGTRRLHRLTLKAIACSFVVILMLIAAWGFLDQVRATKSDRAACERVNKVRNSTGDLEQSLIEAATKRAEIERRPAVKATILEFKTRYEADYEELVASAYDFADGPRSLTVNCTVAFPYPWPLD